MKKEFLTKSFQKTQRVGQEMAQEILKKKKKRKKAFVIGLKGELGSGKTTFLQGFAKGLGIKEKVLSPTFVIIKKFQLDNYSINQLNNFTFFYHIDCYRIKKAKEILDLDFKKIISEPKNIVAIEWPEKIKRIMPKNTLWIEFNFINEKSRKISVSS